MLTLRSVPSVSVLESSAVFSFIVLALCQKQNVNKSRFSISFLFGRRTSVDGALICAGGLKISEIEVNASAAFVFEQALK